MNVNTFTVDELSARKLSSLIKRMSESGHPIIIKTNILSPNLEIYVEQVLAIFLKTTGQEYLKDYIIYFAKELMANAEKANIKRVYFLEKGLDINNAEDYRQGMKHFMEAFDDEHYLVLQKEKGLFIELHIEKKGENIIVEAVNNSALTANEEKELADKIKTGAAGTNFEDAMRSLDNTEGIGLLILIFMIKKLGVWNVQNSIAVEKNNGNTVVRVTIPIRERSKNR